MYNWKYNSTLIIIRIESFSNYWPPLLKLIDYSNYSVLRHSPNKGDSNAGEDLFLLKRLAKFLLFFFSNFFPTKLLVASHLNILGNATQKEKEREREKEVTNSESKARCRGCVKNEGDSQTTTTTMTTRVQSAGDRRVDARERMQNEGEKKKEKMGEPSWACNWISRRFVVRAAFQLLFQLGTARPAEWCMCRVIYFAGRSHVAVTFVRRRPTFASIGHLESARISASTITPEHGDFDRLELRLTLRKLLESFVLFPSFKHNFGDNIEKL